MTKPTKKKKKEIDQHQGVSTSTTEADELAEKEQVEHSQRRSELREQSLAPGGFGDLASRRSAWLYLLRLSHLEANLPSLSKPGVGEDVREKDAQGSVAPVIETIAIDKDGWQIATAEDLDAPVPIDEEKEHEEEEEVEKDGDEEEWSLATSKRKKRGWHKQHLEQRVADASPNTSGTTTASSSSRSRDASSSGHILIRDSEQGSRDAVTETEEGIATRVPQRQKKRRKAKGMQDDLNASIVHVEHSFSQEAEMNGGQKDKEQVALDVRRSFIFLGQSPMRKVRQEELSTVVNGVLQRHPTLHYYQGFHDVISVLLTVLLPHSDDEDASPANKGALDAVTDFASRLSLHFLRDAMTENMTPTMGHLKVLRNILRKSHDDELARRVETASPLPYFALPWLLSMFAHELDMRRSILVFDYLLPRGPSSLLYLCGALIERNKGDVEAMNSDDPAEMHHVLAQLPRFISEETLPLILRDADQLAMSAPIDSPSESIVMGKSSVLHSWSLLPWHGSDEWDAADEQARTVLQGSMEEIVVNALPSPPSSEYGDEPFSTSDELIRNDKALVAKRWWRVAPRKGKDQRGAHLGGGALFAWMGAAGALSVALVIMYGSVGSNSAALAQALGRPPSNAGLGSGFPVGFRAAETLKSLLRNGFRFG